MTTPIVSQEELEQVRCALRIVEPLDKVSPLVLKTLAVVAHCWHGQIPANLWGDFSKAAQAKPAKHIRQALQTDFKRRAAGDFE